MRRVVERTGRSTRWGPKRRFRIDLHGVSVFGPGAEHTLLRWERIESVTVVDRTVVVESSTASIDLPARAFGVPPALLADQLLAARSIESRPDVIADLAGG